MISRTLLVWFLSAAVLGCGATQTERPPTPEDPAVAINRIAAVIQEQCIPQRSAARAGDAAALTRLREGTAAAQAEIPEDFPDGEVENLRLLISANCTVEATDGAGADEPETAPLDLSQRSPLVLEQPLDEMSCDELQAAHAESVGLAAACRSSDDCRARALRSLICPGPIHLNPETAAFADLRDLSDAFDGRPCSQAPCTPPPYHGSRCIAGRCQPAAAADQP